MDDEVINFACTHEYGPNDRERVGTNDISTKAIATG
jgi:hypothetical protein